MSLAAAVVCGDAAAHSCRPSSLPKTPERCKFLSPLAFALLQFSAFKFISAVPVLFHWLTAAVSDAARSDSSRVCNLYFGEQPSRRYF